jgi:type II secretory pathway pseudopilin PulG
MKRASQQSGQTLIETMVAVMILVMGVSAATGLAVYALSSSSSVIKQEIAVGLAREGLEAVKNMRDTNWLKTSLSSTCYSFPSGTNYANCYKEWLYPTGCTGNGNDKGYCLDPDTTVENAGTAYILDIDRDVNHKFWKLTAATGITFGLDINKTVDGNFSTFYSPHLGGSMGNSGYYRKILFIKDPTGPFAKAGSGGAASPGPRVIVKSQVWWFDKKCPVVADFSMANSSCRLELQTMLTNWKDYQP